MHAKHKKNTERLKYPIRKKSKIELINVAAVPSNLVIKPTPKKVAEYFICILSLILFTYFC